jgi:hypothetical protein
MKKIRWYKVEDKIRIVSKKDSEFVVGKGAKTKRYGSVCMEEFEEKLLASLNQLIKMYRSFCQQVLNINVRMADQLQIVKDSIANGGYGSHNDQSTLCCFLENEEIRKEEILSSKFVDLQKNCKLPVVVFSPIKPKNAARFLVHVFSCLWDNLKLNLSYWLSQACDGLFKNANLLMIIRTITIT